jgi:phosphohistidine phosphatase
MIEKPMDRREDVHGQTMKKLLLLRHGKSSWDDTTLADFDRPLAPRGVKAAKRVGRELAGRDWLPEHALVSPAARARETWELVAAELPDAPSADFPRKLYDASPEELLAQIKRVPAKVGTLLLLGHNPALEELARQLAGGDSDHSAIAGLREKFPTAALARFKFDGKWKELGPGAARLTHCLRPRDLR